MTVIARLLRFRYELSRSLEGSIPIYFLAWALVDRLKLGKLVDSFVRLRPRLETLAQRRGGNRETAEDLLQDAWLKLENTHVDGAIRNPEGFITRVAACVVTDHLRKERRRAELDAEVADLLWNAADEISPERILIARENWGAIKDALDTLPERTRRIFLMNRIEGIPHRRIAEIHGITDEAVYYHIRRALERLARLRDELAG